MRRRIPKKRKIPFVIYLILFLGALVSSLYFLGDRRLLTWGCEFQTQLISDLFSSQGERGDSQVRQQSYRDYSTYSRYRTGTSSNDNYRKSRSSKGLDSQEDLSPEAKTIKLIKLYNRASVHMGPIIDQIGSGYYKAKRCTLGSQRFKSMRRSLRKHLNELSHLIEGWRGSGQTLGASRLN